MTTTAVRDDDGENDWRRRIVENLGALQGKLDEAGADPVGALAGTGEKAMREVAEAEAMAKASKPLRQPKLIDASEETLPAEKALRIAKMAFTAGWYAGLEDAPPDTLFIQWMSEMGGLNAVNDIIKTGEDTPS